MNHLTISTPTNLKVTKFTMENVFLRNDFLFEKLSLGEGSIDLFEKVFSLVLLIALSPLMLIVALAIKVSMGGNVFYSQTRVGKGGRPFKIFKFRSMVENAEAATGPVFATTNDPRVTKLGKFLRKSHLDELPQLFNVIKGEMSFVGPRPERTEFVEVFEKEIGDYHKRAMVKPGITGLAQICLPYDALAHEKLEYDLFYIANRKSIIFNAVISYYTALKMLHVFNKVNE